MIRKPTQSEKVQAILDARQDVFSFLQSINKVHAFDDFSKDDMAGLIRAAQEGVQKSLHRQCSEGFSGGTLDDEIPFAPEVRG